MMEWVLVLLGLGILLFAGDALVKGAVNLSLRLGVPALIVSLTIVAFGTSAPELLIAVSAVSSTPVGSSSAVSSPCRYSKSKMRRIVGSAKRIFS